VDVGGLVLCCVGSSVVVGECVLHLLLLLDVLLGVLEQLEDGLVEVADLAVEEELKLNVVSIGLDQLLQVLTECVLVLDAELLRHQLELSLVGRLLLLVLVGSVLRVLHESLGSLYLFLLIPLLFFLLVSHLHVFS
jgi:hypothetical protein